MTNFRPFIVKNTMESASLLEIKKRLNESSPKALKEMILRLAKYKKENKELLSYLLFFAEAEEDYIKDIIAEMDTAFETINTGSLHWAKKSVRKILRITIKHSKYSGNKQTEAVLLIHFCQSMKQYIPSFSTSPTLLNLYQRQLIKIRKAIASLHEDLQYDFEASILELERI